MSSMKADVHSNMKRRCSSVEVLHNGHEVVLLLDVDSDPDTHRALSDDIAPLSHGESYQSSYRNESINQDFTEKPMSRKYINAKKVMKKQSKYSSYLAAKLCLVLFFLVMEMTFWLIIQLKPSSSDICETDKFSHLIIPLSFFSVLFNIIYFLCCYCYDKGSTQPDCLLIFSYPVPLLM